MKKCSRCGTEKPLEAFGKGQAYCRPCKAEYHAAWRAKNRDHHDAYVKAWREANPERKRATTKKWWADNPDKRRAYGDAWRAANREYLRERAKADYRANPERYLANKAKRRARKQGVEHKPYTRRGIYDRDGGRCCICLVEIEYKPRAFHIDHIVPISLGGPDTPANLQLTCPACNLGKRATLEGQIHFAV